MRTIIDDMQQKTLEIMDMTGMGKNDILFTLAYFDSTREKLKMSFLNGYLELTNFLNEIDPDKIYVVPRDFGGREVLVLELDDNPVFILKNNEIMNVEQLKVTMKETGFYS
ncbi:hypothetical protein P4H56_28415 [Bacillus cereus]|nr:hypothetical protein [Bacillus cereus]MED2208150.1 hypothetical protein [Bacillus thuringiensis]MED2699381.1 hypothetical protein [Bacillus thuringiensis]